MSHKNVSRLYDLGDADGLFGFCASRAGAPLFGKMVSGSAGLQACQRLRGSPEGLRYRNGGSSLYMMVAGSSSGVSEPRAYLGMTPTTV